MRKVEAFASHRSNKFYVGIIINKALKMCVFFLSSPLFCVALHCIPWYGFMGNNTSIPSRPNKSDREITLHKMHCSDLAIRSSKETKKKKRQHRFKRFLYILYDYKQIDYGLVSWSINLSISKSWALHVHCAVNGQWNRRSGNRTSNALSDRWMVSRLVGWLTNTLTVAKNVPNTRKT